MSVVQLLVQAWLLGLAVRRVLGVRTGLVRTLLVSVAPRQAGAPARLRFLFDGGTITADEAATIALQEEEIAELRFVTADEAESLLRKAVRRRVLAALDSEQCVYLENWRPATSVRIFRSGSPLD